MGTGAHLGPHGCSVAPEQLDPSCPFSAWSPVGLRQRQEPQGVTGGVCTPEASWGLGAQLGPDPGPGPGSSSLLNTHNHQEGQRGTSNCRGEFAWACPLPPFLSLLKPLSCLLRTPLRRGQGPREKGQLSLLSSSLVTLSPIRITERLTLSVSRTLYLLQWPLQVKARG